MGKYFGTDGFRGRVNTELTVRHAYAIGRFLGRRFATETRGARIIVGRDTRISGDMIYHAICAGVHSLGGDVYDMHVASTPEVSFALRCGVFDCGVMISASHNAFYDNGIKLISREGEKMSDDITAEAEAYIDIYMSRGDDRFCGDMTGTTTDLCEMRERYIDDIAANVDLGGMRICVDCANGSAASYAAEIFSRCGADALIINDKPSGTNINLNCGSTNVAMMREVVLRNGLCAGFAFDGDADRCICVDGRGSIVDGDKMIYILARRLYRQGRLFGKKAVLTVMSNGGAVKALDECGIGCEITAVGDRHVYERMKKLGLTLGGEPSGHIIIGDRGVTGDGILTAVEICREMCEREAKLFELCDIEMFPVMAANLPISRFAEDIDGRIFEISDKITRDMRGKGRIIIRKSGTEPLIRIRAECEDEYICKKYFDTAVLDVRRITDGE